MPRNLDGVARVLHGTGGLEEEHRLLRRAAAAFLGVFPVVQSDGEEVGGNHRREQLAGPHDPIGRVEFAKNVAGDLAGGAVGLQRRVSRSSGTEVTDDSHAGDSVAGEAGKSTAVRPRLEFS